LPFRSWEVTAIFAGLAGMQLIGALLSNLAAAARQIPLFADRLNTNLTPLLARWHEHRATPANIKLVPSIADANLEDLWRRC